MKSRTWVLVFGVLLAACVRAAGPSANNPGKEDSDSATALESSSTPGDGQGDTPSTNSPEAGADSPATSSTPKAGAESPADANTPTVAIVGHSTISTDGFLQFNISEKTTITDISTTLTVPKEPRPAGTLFLTSGLEPGGVNYQPIDHGVLQGVLTWGPSCAPGKQPTPYSSWWVSAQYVNSNGKQPGYTGCLGGDVMMVAPGDQLTMHSTLTGTQWQLLITNSRGQSMVSFSIDLRGQAQNKIVFSLVPHAPPEDPSAIPAPPSDVIFTNTTVSFADPSSADCGSVVRGPRDAVVGIKASENGLRCSIDKIVLRAQGVTAFDPAAPGP